MCVRGSGSESDSSQAGHLATDRISRYIYLALTARTKNRTAHIHPFSLPLRSIDRASKRQREQAHGYVISNTFSMAGIVDKIQHMLGHDDKKDEKKDEKKGEHKEGEHNNPLSSLLHGGEKKQGEHHKDGEKKKKEKKEGHDGEKKDKKKKEKKKDDGSDSSSGSDSD
ncbi:hypothetical protein Mapa_013922 [Marchantia paleacea]|nr:hypothetical protein Mapa_013922 [Marchantia paleacea]